MTRLLGYGYLMRFLTRISLAVAVCLALLGCGGTNEGPTPTASPPTDAATETKVTETGLDDLIAALKDGEPAVRQKAALDLKKKGPQAKTAIPALVDNLKHTDQSVRQASAEALTAIGAEGRVAGVRACLVLLKTEDDKGRQQGEELLATISPVTRKTLSLKDAGKRRDVAAELVKAGPELADAVAVLLELHREARTKKDADLLQIVSYVLQYGKVGQPEALPTLTAALDDSDPQVRVEAAKILGRMGPKAAPALPALTAKMGRERDKQVYGQYRAAYDQISGRQPASTPVASKGDDNWKGDNQWATHFPTFLRRLGYILGLSPVAPMKDDQGVLSLVEDGRPQFLVPQRYPMGANVRIEDTTHIFHEKTITWDLVVERVETAKDTGKVIVHFVPPTQEELRIANSRITEFDEFSVAMEESSKDQAKRLRPGNKVVIKAESGNEPMDGIFFMFGVGQYNGQIHVSIRLRRGTLMVVR